MVRIDRHGTALPVYHGAYQHACRPSRCVCKSSGLHLEANYRGGVSVRRPPCLRPCRGDRTSGGTAWPSVSGRGGGRNRRAGREGGISPVDRWVPHLNESFSIEMGGRAVAQSVCEKRKCIDNVVNKVAAERNLYRRRAPNRLAFLKICKIGRKLCAHKISAGVVAGLALYGCQPESPKQRQPLCGVIRLAGPSRRLTTVASEAPAPASGRSTTHRQKKPHRPRKKQRRW